MPLKDVSNNASTTVSTRTPYKADRFAGFVIPGLTVPAPVAASHGKEGGNGTHARRRDAVAKAPARQAKTNRGGATATNCTTTKRRRAPSAAASKKEKSAASSAADAPRPASPSPSPAPPSLVDDDAAPTGTQQPERVVRPLVDDDAHGPSDASERTPEHTPELDAQDADVHHHTPGGVMALGMGETPLAAYLAPEGTPYAYPASFTPYQDAATPIAGRLDGDAADEGRFHHVGSGAGEDSEAYDNEPTMLIPSFRPILNAAAAGSTLPTRVEEIPEEDTAEDLPSPIPHVRSTGAAPRGAGPALAEHASGGRCLLKEASALLDGQEADVARALKEAEDAEAASKAGGRKRSSRRATIAPSRYGEFLSWDSVKAIGTPGQGLKKRETGDREEVDVGEDGDDDFVWDESENGDGCSARRSRACGMGSGDNGATCPIPTLRFAPASTASDPTVREVQDKVSALMQMAEDFLPPDEDEKDAKRKGKGAKDDMEGKSLREALSDAWNGQSYYAKLAAQMSSPEPAEEQQKKSPTVKAKSKAAATKKGSACGLNDQGKKTAKAGSASSRRKSVMPAVTRETASSLAKVTTRRKSLGGQAAAAIREALEKKEAQEEDSSSSSAKKTSKTTAADGVTKKKRKSVGKAVEASLAALMAESKKSTCLETSAKKSTSEEEEVSVDRAAQQNDPVGWMTQDNALFAAGSEERSPIPAPAAQTTTAPIASDADDGVAHASLERQIALLRAELAMAKTDLHLAQREVESMRESHSKAVSDAESLRALVAQQAGQLKTKDEEVESLQGKLSVLKTGARAAVSQVAAALKAQLQASLDAVGMAETEALHELGGVGPQ